ncbi:MAG: hypothetical protein N2486_10190 [Caloramator sp.]|nr:hypothetical protein [Caloramator sp.]
MKKLLILLSLLLLTSCTGVNPVLKNKFLNQDIERIVITNTRYAGRYTIIDKKAITRFKNKVLRAKEVQNDSNLEPDFIFDFYSENKKVASFKYIAKINEENVANLYDEEGKLYNISTSIEDEFIKRLLKTNRNQNVPDYYVSAINLILDKIDKSDITVAIDLKKEIMTLKYLTSMDIKNIFEGINRNGVNIVLLQQAKEYDYLIAINTKKYSGNSVEAEISVVDPNGMKTVYVIEGNYNGKWEFFIAYK